VAAHPSMARVLGYLGGYFALRIAMVWRVGIRGLNRPGLWRKLPLIPLWDALAFFIWLISFGRSSIRWRDQEYVIRNGRLVPVTPTAAGSD
jgi:ceramide glucosyltransferase